MFAAGMAPSVYFINEGDVSYEAARAGEEGSDPKAEPQRQSWRDLLRDKRILTFAITVVVFYCQMQLLCRSWEKSSAVRTTGNNLRGKWQQP
jgi:hypothetical protein